VHWVAPAAA
jgi:hypothetical protein